MMNAYFGITGIIYDSYISAILPKNVFGKILNWRFPALYGKKKGTSLNANLAVVAQFAKPPN